MRIYKIKNSENEKIKLKFTFTKPKNPEPQTCYGNYWASLHVNLLFYRMRVSVNNWEYPSYSLETNFLSEKTINKILKRIKSNKEDIKYYESQKARYYYLS